MGITCFCDLHLDNLADAAAHWTYEKPGEINWLLYMANEYPRLYRADMTFVASPLNIAAAEGGVDSAMLNAASYGVDWIELLNDFPCAYFDFTHMPLAARLDLLEH